MKRKNALIVAVFVVLVIVGLRYMKGVRPPRAIQTPPVVISEQPVDVAPTPPEVNVTPVADMQKALPPPPPPPTIPPVMNATPLVSSVGMEPLAQLRGRNKSMRPSGSSLSSKSSRSGQGMQGSSRPPTRLSMGNSPTKRQPTTRDLIRARHDWLRREQEKIVHTLITLPPQQALLPQQQQQP